MVATRTKSGGGRGRRPARARGVTIPDWVVDLESFRAWTYAEDFPELGRICFFDGGVFVDMSTEELFTHFFLKSEIARALGNWVEQHQLGRCGGDGAYIVNRLAGLSTVPDAVFVSFDSIAAGTATFIQGRRAGFVEIEGSPDLVVEVVSASSVGKDKHRFLDLYAQARIREYWLIDARRPAFEFDILRLSADGYAKTASPGGWMRSPVLGAKVRLTQTTARDGHPKFTLHLK